MDDAHHAFAAGDEDELAVGVEATGVDAGAGLLVGDDFAGEGIDDSKGGIPAADEEALAGSIVGHAVRADTVVDGVGLGQPERVNVDDGDRALVGQVHIESPLPVGDGRLRIAFQIEFARGLASRRVKDRDLLTHGKDAFRERIVEDGSFALTFLIVFSVSVSKMVTDPSPPFEVKPRFNSGAIAIP